MENTHSLTVIKNTAPSTTINTTAPIKDTPNNGELIGKIIAMNLRNRIAQEANKTRIVNMS